MKLRTALLVLTLAWTLAACASRQHVTVAIPHDVTAPTSATMAGPATSTGISVHCTDDATVFAKDGYEITFVGRRGYHGELGERRGRLVVGEVVLRYDGDSLSFVGPLSRGSYASVPAGWSAEIDQSGASRVR